MEQSAHVIKVCWGSKYAEFQSVLRSKVCQGVKCVEMQSELGCKVFQGAKWFGEQTVHQPITCMYVQCTVDIYSYLSEQCYPSCTWTTTDICTNSFAEYTCRQNVWHGSKSVITFSKPPILEIFLPKFHGLVLGLVVLIDANGIDVAQPIWFEEFSWYNHLNWGFKKSKVPIH